MKPYLAFLILVFFNFTFAAEVKLAQIKTGDAKSSESLVFKGGKILKQSISNHTAFLIKHDNEYILFDTGLGKNIKEQFNKDMPWWGKALFSYENVSPAVLQLQKQNITVKDIYLSHLHWDHASALADFPTSKFHVPDIEMKEISDPHVPPKAAAFLKSQFEFSQEQWSEYKFSQKEFMGFEKTFDVFGDQSVVLVSLPGHTLGSVGMIVTTAKKKYFLVGDLVWRKKALEALAPKFIVASMIVDGNRDEVKSTMEKVLNFHKTYPEVEIIPAHDEEVQGPLGYFPSWVND